MSEEITDASDTDPIDKQTEWHRRCLVCGNRNAIDVQSCAVCGVPLDLPRPEASLYVFIRDHSGDRGCHYSDIRAWAVGEHVNTTLDVIIQSLLDRGLAYEPVIGLLKVI